ncbi:MAG: hypothetical protein WA803_11720 [Steroidobacteraceae bacterium]
MVRSIIPSPIDLADCFFWSGRHFTRNWLQAADHQSLMAGRAQVDRGEEETDSGIQFLRT